MIMNVYLVIPTIRSLDFLAAWGSAFQRCHLIIVEDHPTKEITTPTKGFLSIHHYTWNDIRSDFGKDEWIFPRQNAGIRSYGFWKAHVLGADVVITLDDDCYPTKDDFVSGHLDNLASAAPASWFPTFPHPSYMYTRGFPYEVRGVYKTVVSHGLWSNKMDLDAKTQLSIGDVNVEAYPSIRQFVPFGYYFPMSSMNLAFTREVIPLMYFPLMGKDPDGKPWGFDRYDDIWAGVIVKKILDHHKLAVVNGSPFVEHVKASDPIVNLEKEKSGMEKNEALWKQLQEVTIPDGSLLSGLQTIVKFFNVATDEYMQKLSHAMFLWGERFV